MLVLPFLSLMFLLLRDVEKIQSGMGDKVAAFLQYFTTFISGFIIGFVVNWKLALVVSVSLPILSVMGVILTKVHKILWSS